MKTPKLVAGPEGDAAMAKTLGWAMFPQKPGLNGRIEFWKHPNPKRGNCRYSPPPFTTDPTTIIREIEGRGDRVAACVMGGVIEHYGEAALWNPLALCETLRRFTKENHGDTAL